MRTAIAAGFLIGLLAGGPAVAADAAAAATIARVDTDWLDAMKAGDADRLAAPYAPSGIFVLANGEVLRGRAAVADLYRKRLARISKVLGGGIHRDGMAAGSGGVVYEWGHGGLTSIDQAGRRSTGDGPYLTVWKRSPDGVWRIVRNLVF